MMKSEILNLLQNKKKEQKFFAVLVDPDKANQGYLRDLIVEAEAAKVDFFFVGGSLITSSDLCIVIAFLKAKSFIPVIIFPGSNLHIDGRADAILLLSLVSGRNPEFLIGQHVVAAPVLKKSGLEIIPTAYLLIDGGRPTTVSYMSGTAPIPKDKPEIAVATALAAEMLGMKVVYLDAGSGAHQCVTPQMLAMVKKNISGALIVGGGINTPHKALQSWEAGADVVVIGTAVESDLKLISQIAASKKEINEEVVIKH